MKYPAIRYHLRPYKILERRKTTINHAFAAAIAPFDEYDDERIKCAVETLGQDPNEPLVCVYCERPAQTWDHVFGTVKNSRFSGHGHRLGNLLPACKSCNSSKGNKNWKDFLVQLAILEEISDEVRENRESRITRYLAEHAYTDAEPIGSPEYERLLGIHSEVLALLREADDLAEAIRNQAESK
jgi:hypothetical protein